jgi:N,N-dimethylformamidase
VLELHREHSAELKIGVRDFASRRAIVTTRVRPASDSSSVVTIGAGDDGGPTLNARIGRFSLSVDGARAEWIFRPLGPHQSVMPTTGRGAALRVHNRPTFAVKSARWDGSILDPRQNAAHYDAVHLHDDDLGHFDWPASHELEIPERAPSGVYAFEVVTAVGAERIPFFVRPASPTARLAFLVPTATYVAYGDEYLPTATYPWRCWDRGHQFAQDNRLRSLYDAHDDGSGVSLSSLRRPRATLRDDSRYPLSDCPHLLPVDLQFLRFCGRENLAIDLLTDHDLHVEGAAALRAYAGVFTGSHPEYWSSAMLAALDEHLGRGGHLAYLGGNGFYLCVAIDGDGMELRRAPDDELWASDAAEMHMATNGERGGYWGALGRPTQSLLGSTFLMMGFGPSRPYRRLPSSYAPQWAWAFEGVGDRPIGDAGSMLGGAAGYEVDGVIESWPQPRGLVRLATADDFDDSFQLRRGLAGADAAGDAVPRRADMTIYRHEGGGLVFSVGSVAWCAALPASGQNAVGAITLNIARRFEGHSHE